MVLSRWLRSISDRISNRQQRFFRRARHSVRGWKAPPACRLDDAASISVERLEVRLLLSGFTVVESFGATSVTEAGSTDTFTVVLTVQPVSDVVLTVSSADTGETTASPTTLTFTTADWDTAQTVTVTGIDDFDDDGDQITAVTVSVDDVNSDDGYDGVSDQIVNVTTTDDDSAGSADFHVPTNGIADAYTLRLNGMTAELYDSSSMLLASRQFDPGDALIIHGEDGQTDNLTVDFSGGDPIPSGGVTFHGGAGGNDSLTLTGGSATTIGYEFTDANDGSVDIDGSLITYTGLEPITDNMDVASRVFTFNGGDETISVTDTGGADGMSTIDSTMAESVEFANPTVSLTIDAGSGGDIINLSGLDAGFDADLTVNGSADTNTVNIDGDIDVGSGAISIGALNDIASIDLAGGSITTSGQATLTATGAVTDNDAAIDVMADALTVTAGSIGAAGNDLDTSVNSLTTDTSAANGDQFIHESTGLTDLNLNAGGGSIELVDEGQISDSSGDGTDIAADSFSLTITTSGEFGVGNNRIETDVASLSATTSGQDRNVYIAEANSLTNTNITIAPADIHLSAGGDINTGSGILTGNGANLESGGNIDVDTTVSQLNFSTTANGNITVDETNALSQLTIDAGSGDVTITAGGAITDGDGTTDIAADEVSLTAPSIGTMASPLALDANSLTTDTSASNGDQFFTEADGLTDLDLDAGMANVSLTLTLGSILDTSSDGIDVTAAEAALTLSDAAVQSIGASGNPIEFSVESLVTDTTAGLGDQYLSEDDSLTAGAADINGDTIYLASGTFLTDADGSLVGQVVVEDGATLGGTGTVSGSVTVNNGGTVAPGTSPGILSTDDVTFNLGSTFEVELNGPTAGTEHDQLDVTGTVSLGDATLNTIAGVGFGASLPDDCTSLIIINNDDVDDVVGTFNGLPEGSELTIDGVDFLLTYEGGDGNDVVLINKPLTLPDVYVDNDWTGTVIGDDPDGPGPAHCYGIDSFDTIQEGVDAVDAAGTVHVNAGTYDENVSITKDVTVDGEAGTATLPEPDEVIVDPTTGDGFSISAPAADVTLSDLTVQDGDNGISATSGNVTLNNVQSNDHVVHGIALTGVGTVILTDISTSGNASAGLEIIGAGAVTLNGGTYDGITVTGADSVTLATSAVSSTEDVSIAADNAVTLNTSLDADAATILLAANQDSAGTDSLTMDSGTSITTTNDTASAVTLQVNTLAGGTGNATISGITAGGTSGTTGGRITVDAVMGAIVDADLDANNLSAGNAVLTAQAGVGALGDPIETTIARVEGTGGTGGFYLVNTGALVVGGISPTIGVSATTEDIDIQAASPLTIEEDVSTAGHIFLKADDSPDVGDDLTVAAGVTVSSTANHIHLEAGDNITLQATSVVSAPGGIFIDSDSDDADPGIGTTVTIAAQLIAPAGISVTGGSDDDIYDFYYPDGSTNTGTVGISDPGGTDDVIVNGTAGADELFLTTTEPPTGVGDDLVTRGDATSEPIIVPDEIESLRINGGESNDIFHVQPSQLFPVTIDGGPPGFGDPGVPPGDILILDTTNAFTFVDGCSIQVLGGVPAYQIITLISIENLPLLPTSAGPIQRYDFNETVASGNMFVQSPTQAGWAGVTANTLYSGGSGYGWDQPLQSFQIQGTPLPPNAGPAANLINDGHYFTAPAAGATRTFTADVGNGWVVVTVTFGSIHVALDGIEIRNGDTGDVMATGLDSDVVNWDHVTFPVLVTDGSLDLEFEDTMGPYYRVSLAGLEIRPADTGALLSMGFAVPLGPLPADGTTVDTFTLVAAPANALVTVDITSGTLVGTDAEPAIEGFQVVTDGSGEATIQIRRPSGSVENHVSLSSPTGEKTGCIVIEYGQVDTKYFDFNVLGSPTQSGYTQVLTSDLYEAVRGHGWLSSPNAIAFTSNSDPAIADLVNDAHRNSSPGTFRVNLDNGQYEVHVYMGDSGDHQSVSVAANGTPVITNQSLTHNRIFEATFPVTVATGQLNLTFSQNDTVFGDPHWVINGLEIRPASMVGAIALSNVGAVPADGMTVTTINGTSTATPGSLVTVSTTLGTIVTPDASSIFAGIQVAVGAGGSISFDIRSPHQAGTPTVDVRTTDGALHTQVTDPAFLTFTSSTVRRFDFNLGFMDSNMSATAAGFTGVRTNHVAAIDGFGWTSQVEIYTAVYTPPIFTTLDLYRDGHASRTGGAPATFRVQVLPATNYDVRAYIGHYGRDLDQVQVTAEGQPAAPVVATAWNQFTTVTVLNATDSNADGYLDIQFADVGGILTGWTVVGLDLAESATGLPPAAPLLAAIVNDTPAPQITQSELNAAVLLVRNSLASASLTPDQRDRLESVRVTIADLNGLHALGLAGSREIVIDDDGAGFGWSTDVNSVTPGRYDLLTVIAHELSHVLGHDHSEDGLMQAILSPGERLLDLDTAFIALNVPFLD